MARPEQHNCLFCGALFRADRRNERHQNYCSEPGCRKASKAASRRAWLAKAENQDYFRGPENVARVQAWRAEHPGYWRRSKGHLLPRFGQKHLDELSQQDVIDAHQSMRKAGYATGTANKWIVQIRYMYNVAKKLKVPGSAFNPGADIKQFQVEGRERFLSQGETMRLREAVEKSENTQLKYIVALLLILGCRKRELLDAKWEHFDLERRSWRIPISKSGKARHVPLSTTAVAMLAQVPRWDGCPFVVPKPCGQALDK